MSDEVIVRSDDGKLYRISRTELFANPVPLDDPAQQHAAGLTQAAEVLSQHGLKELLGCVVAFTHTSD